LFSEGQNNLQEEVKDLLELVVSKQKQRKEKAEKQKTPKVTQSDDPDAPQKKKQRRNTKSSDGKPMELAEPTTPYKGSQ
jgi:hypothetical protein